MSEPNELSGLALREAVAVKVMGYEMRQDWMRDGSGVPAYESDIAAAWLVVEKWLSMDEWHSFSLSVSSRIQPPSGASRTAKRVAVFRTGTIAIDDFCGAGDTVPEAICRAALAAMEGK